MNYEVIDIPDECVDENMAGMAANLKAKFQDTKFAGFYDFKKLLQNTTDYPEILKIPNYLLFFGSVMNNEHENASGDLRLAVFSLQFSRDIPEFRGLWLTKTWPEDSKIVVVKD